MTDSAERHTPAISTSKPLAASPNSSLRNHQNPHHWKIRNRTFPAAEIRLRKDSSRSRKRIVPATPRFGWKFDEANLSVRKLPAPRERKPGRKRRSRDGVRVSARKLAAALWHLQLPEASRSFRRQRKGPPEIPAVGHVQVPHNGNPNKADFDLGPHAQFWSSFSIPHLKNGFFSKLQPSMQISNSSMERATKWDPGCSITMDNIYRFRNHFNTLEHQQISSISVISTLQAEIKQSRAHIHELKTECRSSNKKLKSFVRKLTEEKASWRRKEHEKLRAVIDGVKNDLNKERKICERMEILNNKLVGDIAEAKLCAKRFLQDYEKEKKAREILDEVCDELANEIGEDKAEVEALKRESLAICEEVEEERKMLQMAEVWREERVQMKLIEAKLALEEKYYELSRLIADVGTFLSSRSPTSDVVDMRKDELPGNIANSVVIKDIEELSYQPRRTLEDIVSVYEDLHSGEPNERDIEPCCGYTPTSDSSKIHIENPEIDDLNESRVPRSKNRSVDRNGDVEDGSSWETANHGEQHGHGISRDGSNLSVSGLHKERNALGSGTEWGEDADYDLINREISEVYGVSTRKSRKKASSILRLWKPYQHNSDNYKMFSVEAMDRRLSNGRISSGAASDRGSAQVGINPWSLGHWSSPDSGNPHIKQGMKGCIEWPRGIQKSSLKSKLSEARVESQKIQVHHILKQNT
ncbi:uncharacterized protein LOC131221293 isoform X2 [Magnolia sinica]|uniref:uncharacterized protein LOC131221293 isoform X2 n=1 Tax=Magnolia sinica TaxID=86752 RepID=UPI00265B7158|nr:uncharacterized protein LOC131221293 isoform X2 [Magnolia sinica]